MKAGKPSSRSVHGHAPVIERIAKAICIARNGAAFWRVNSGWPDAVWMGVVQAVNAIARPKASVILIVTPKEAHTRPENGVWGR